MADDSRPPGWPFNEEPPPVPPAAPAPAMPPPGIPPARRYEPPAHNHEPPPPSYEPPTHSSASYQPPAAGIGQPPPPPPGSAPPPLVKRKRNIWVTVAAVIGFFVLGIGACTALFIATVKAPVDESNRFLAHINEGDYAAAAAMTTTQCTGTSTAPAALAEFFGGGPIEYDLKGSAITNNTATVTGRFVGTAGQTIRDSFIIVYLSDDDGWKVCGFQTS